MLRKLKNKLKHNHELYLKLAPIFGLYRGTRMRMARLLHGIDNNLVVFSAFDGKSYNDNPRYISEALHEMRPETEIVWLFRNVSDAKKKFGVPDYVRCYNSIQKNGVSAMARARVLVDNFTKRSYLKFNFKKQTYIQTWHGDRAFKKVGFDNPGWYKTILEDKCALGITGSDYGDRQFRSAFHFKGELMKVGYPRNDILIRNDAAEKAAVRRRLGIDEHTKLLLYAPTFRDRATYCRAAQEQHLDLSRVIGTLKEHTGENWLCLMRAHYLSYGISVQGAEGVMDVSDYPEMAELLLIADALITDYSSCAGDYALTRRPIWLYQDDLEDYKNNNRALYFDMADSPYMVAATPDEMDALIRKTTVESAKENCDAILRFYGEAETGHASESIARYIIEKLDDPKEIRK